MRPPEPGRRRGFCLAVVTAAALWASAGEASATPSLEPTSFDFGSQTVGTSSAPKTFTLTVHCNIPNFELFICSDADTVTTSIDASGPFEAENVDCPTPFTTADPYEKKCTIRITFRPIAAGRATGTLSTGGPTAELIGTGVATAGPPPPPPPPSNLFSFGKLKLDKSRGTATLFVVLSGGGTGTLALSGKGLAEDAVANASGTVSLKIRPRGKAKRKLGRTGRATVQARVTFAPTGGVAATQTKTVHLKKERRS
jgi:hypothetical protein